MKPTTTGAPTRQMLAAGLLSVLLSASLPANARAVAHDSGDESTDEETLFIGNINGDGVADTIYGRITTSAQYRPTAIAWGVYRPPGALPLPAAIRRTTRFDYPDWLMAGASLSVGDVNADSLADIVLYLWGDAASGDPSRPRSRSYLLFGSRSADTVGIIDLAAAPGDRPRALHPYPIATGGLLVDGAIRDHTGIRSYVRLPVVAPPERDPLPGDPATTASAAKVTLHPNPTDNRVEIVATGLKPGICSILIIGLDGRQAGSERMEVGIDGRLALTLGLESIPSGYYIIRLDDAEQSVRSLPLLVVH